METGDVKGQQGPVDPMLHGFDQQQLEAELSLLDPNEFPVAHKILKAKLDNCQYNVPTDPEYLTVDIYKPIRLCKKILIPHDRHPGFNFVGKIIGSGGKNLQALAAANKCRIVVCGKGTTKDLEKEAQLLASGDPKYAHYNDVQHVKVETIGGAVIAYQRITNVLEQLHAILQPVMPPRQMVDDGTGKMVPSFTPPSYAPPPGTAGPFGRPPRGPPRGRAGGPPPGTMRMPRPPPPRAPPASSAAYGGADYSGAGDYAGNGYSGYSSYDYGGGTGAEGYAEDYGGYSQDYYSPPPKRAAAGYEQPTVAGYGAIGRGRGAAPVGYPGY